MTARGSVGRVVVTTVTAAAGLGMLVGGTWALVRPDAADTRGLGALEVAIGLGLLLALIWRDAVATVLAGSAVGAACTVVILATDPGALGPGAWPAAAATVLLVIALVLRVAQLGCVLGRVRPATHPALAPFVEQKTMTLTTYRRTGEPVSTAVSVAVDGDRAVFRSFERAGKVRRLRNDSAIELAPATWRGTPTGPAIRGRVRLLDGADAHDAARLVRSKHPLLHGVLVPLLHRAGRKQVGRTVHAELVPLADTTRTTESADRATR